MATRRARLRDEARASGPAAGAVSPTRDHDVNTPHWGRIRLLMVPTLVLVVAVGVGAQTAGAADGCGCHTAVPPTGGAPAAHAPLVGGAGDCTVCHAD